MNRQQRRRMARQFPKAEQSINRFGTSLAQNIDNLNERLPKLKSAYIRGEWDVNPALDTALKTLRNNIDDLLIAFDIGGKDVHGTASGDVPDSESETV